MSRGLSRSVAALLTALALLETGCATTMHDARVSTPPQARHCDDSEVVTTTHLAVLPIPLVAFFMPRVTLNAPDSSAFLAKCGGQQQVNRTVQANYAACVPTVFLTTLITLGIVGACPKLVSWHADVVD
jgi:hypothetical protein